MSAGQCDTNVAVQIARCHLLNCPPLCGCLHMGLTTIHIALLLRSDRFPLVTGSDGVSWCFTCGVGREDAEVSAVIPGTIPGGTFAGVQHRMRVHAARQPST